MRPHGGELLEKDEEGRGPVTAGAVFRVIEGQTLTHSGLMTLTQLADVVGCM